MSFSLFTLFILFSAFVALILTLGQRSRQIRLFCINVTVRVRELSIQDQKLGKEFEWRWVKLNDFISGPNIDKMTSEFWILPEEYIKNKDWLK